MKKAIVFLAEGFEEMEAIGTVDILRRGGVNALTASITDDLNVVCSPERGLAGAIP